MRFICCTVLVLSAVLLIVSLDQRPDPPATVPHTANAKAAPDLRACPDVFCKQRLSCDYAGGSSHLQVCLIALTLDARPSRPSDWIALTGHAADPSPPAV